MRSSPYMVTRGTDSIHLGGKWDFLLRWLTNEQWALLSGTTTLRSPQGTVNSEQKHEQRGYMGEGLKNAGGQAWWYFPVMSALRRQRRPVSLSLKPSWSTQFDKPRLCKETRPCIKHCRFPDNFTHIFHCLTWIWMHNSLLYQANSDMLISPCFIIFTFWSIFRLWIFLHIPPTRFSSQMNVPEIDCAHWSTIYGNQSKSRAQTQSTCFRGENNYSWYSQKHTNDIHSSFRLADCTNTEAQA